MLFRFRDYSAEMTQIDVDVYNERHGTSLTMSEVEEGIAASERCNAKKHGVFDAVGSDLMDKCYARLSEKNIPVVHDFEMRDIVYERTKK